MATDPRKTLAAKRPQGCGGGFLPPLNGVLSPAMPRISGSVLRARPHRVTPQAAFESLQALVELQNFDVALQTVKALAENILGQHEWRSCLKVLELLPQTRLQESGAWASVYTRALRGDRQSGAIIEFVATLKVDLFNETWAEVLVDLAWSQVCFEQHRLAQDTLLGAQPYLDGVALAYAWRLLGQTGFELADPSWRSAFDQAKNGFLGRDLGLCLIEEGTCLSRAGLELEARACWLRAIPLLDTDRYHLAWVQHCLGGSYLRDANIESERHFWEVERLSAHAHAAAFSSRASSGLGGAHRLRGEWKMALTRYRQAAASAVEADDAQVAWWGLGHTLRLQGKVEQALEALHRAAHFLPSTWVQVELAAAHLCAGDAVEAKRLIAPIKEVHGQARQRLGVIRAELARIAEDSVTLAGSLAEIQLDALVACEERVSFPVLFDHLAQSGFQMPHPLDWIEKQTVFVEAFGALEVRVNGRLVRLKPTGRCGELLVLLLECGGVASIERLIMRLWPETSVSSKRQALWQLVQRLRLMLAWDESVIALGEVYKLDPETHWVYTPAKVHVRKHPRHKFLEGVYSEWVLENREGVSQADGELNDLSIKTSDY